MEIYPKVNACWNRCGFPASFRDQPTSRLFTNNPEYLRKALFGPLTEIPPEDYEGSKELLSEWDKMSTQELALEIFEAFVSHYNLTLSETGSGTYVVKQGGGKFAPNDFWL